MTNSDRKVLVTLHIIKRIERVMKSEGKADADVIRALLFCLSGVYGPLIRLKTGLYRQGHLKARRLACPVICIGNITLGGTGKTPMTIYLARLLVKLGLRPAVLSRGFRGRSERRGGIVSDGRRLFLGVEDAGDEPLMMALNLPKVPILVGRNRYQSGIQAVGKFKANILLLDDGFQHLALKRDLDLVLLDWKRPMGNGWLFPRGVLREPPAALRRAHVLILTRSEDGVGTAADRLDECNIWKGIPTFKTRHKPYIAHIVAGREREPSKSGFAIIPEKGQNPFADDKLDPAFKLKKGYAFSGIAQNRAFREGARRMGLQLSGYSEYPDHHPYDLRDLAEIHAQAGKSGARFLITTEKDFVRLDKNSCHLDLVVIGVKMEFMQTGFDEMISARVRQLSAISMNRT
jgi:tetraacyldisaccharide 4'-kinase